MLRFVRKIVTLDIFPINLIENVRCAVNRVKLVRIIILVKFAKMVISKETRISARNAVITASLAHLLIFVKIAQ